MVSLRLGTTNCVVLQSEESIRQALLTKADHFDSRPNFLRFHLMFGGSKKNGRTLLIITRSQGTFRENLEIFGIQEFGPLFPCSIFSVMTTLFRIFLNSIERYFESIFKEQIQTIE